MKYITYKSGDMFYYGENNALGILIEKQGDIWTYMLRSPRTTAPDGPCIQNINSATEQAFRTGVEEGILQYWPKVEGEMKC